MPFGSFRKELFFGIEEENFWFFFKKKTPPEATGVFRGTIEYGSGPTKGSESPFATEGREGGGEKVYLINNFFLFTRYVPGAVTGVTIVLPGSSV